MTARRSRGDGGLYWSEQRQRWIAELTVGYTPAGKRIVKRASGKNKTKARDKLRKIVRDYEDGLVLTAREYTVAQAVNDWLSYGLHGRSAKTVEDYGSLADNHIISRLGSRRLRSHRADMLLTADDVDVWLAELTDTHSTRTLRLLHSILSRIVTFAQARDKAHRNVVALCGVPKGQPGRPSKAFTLPQAAAVLDAAEPSPLHAYIVLSLLIGARTEELRPLGWDHVDLKGDPNAGEPIPPSIAVWRSVRDGGDTKTKKSRRTLAVPTRCVLALETHHERQDASRRKAGKRWQENGLVFASSVGTPLDSHNVRREFRKVVTAAGLTGNEWTPREMRHSFVSALSASGVTIEEIARLVGHTRTSVTETVYRLQIRPVLEAGAVAMNHIFPMLLPTDE